MLVIVGVCKLPGGGIGIDVHRPQHSARVHKSYSSKKEAQTVLAAFGITEESMADVFSMLPDVQVNAKLNFPPLDVPQLALGAEFPGWKESD